jgi:hypothetical protein
MIESLEQKISWITPPLSIERYKMTVTHANEE